MAGKDFPRQALGLAQHHSVPAIRDSNHVAHVTASMPEQIDRLLARVEREFAHCPHGRFDLDAAARPEFEARLTYEGYERYKRTEALVMLLEGAEVGRAMFRSWQAKSPPVRVWLAFVDGEPAAYCSSWEGVDGVGQVEALFTHPEYRHRGLATALLLHCVADCRAHGAGPVVIVCDPEDTPKQMYAALGFRPVAIRRSWWKQV
ncbi:MAG: GNAT family N-acetyltransferase [Dehalococcoidia bacterium]|nr:GNAT family N-acetyltransferase [Dehalococcoidia bacterium]MDZ4278592.1 GNAT family N-acetyltransferase [Dehalococcoidia bacterium]